MRNHFESGASKNLIIGEASLNFLPDEILVVAAIDQGVYFAVVGVAEQAAALDFLTKEKSGKRASEERFLDCAGRQRMKRSLSTPCRQKASALRSR